MQNFILFYFWFLFLLYSTLQYCIGFAIYWLESTTGVHAFRNMNPPSHLPPHNISVGHPHAPAPSMLCPASDIDWWFDSYMIVYMFQCHSPKSSHPLPLPLSPKVRSYYISRGLTSVQKKRWPQKGSGTEILNFFLTFIIISAKRWCYAVTQWERRSGVLYAKLGGIQSLMVACIWRIWILT